MCPEASGGARKSLGRLGRGVLRGSGVPGQVTSLLGVLGVVGLGAEGRVIGDTTCTVAE